MTHRVVWLTTLSVVAVFFGVWFVFGNYLPAWSDEISHMAAAKGLLLTGKPLAVAIDRCAAVRPEPYTRGIEVTQMVAMSYRLFGESLRAARTVPFVFTLATWLVYVLYGTLRGFVTPPQIMMSALLFFGQSLVLEQALNARIYAPMFFFLLLAMMALWEARAGWQRHKQVRAALWLMVAIASIAVPTPRWHVIMLPIIGLSLVLFWWDRQSVLRASLRDLRDALRRIPRPWNVALMLVMLYAILCVIGLSPLILDVLSARLLGTQRVHISSWDNVFGLFRFALVTNVLLVVWLRRKGSSKLTVGADFHTWLLVTGLVSGLLIGALMNHTFIFYSRFFYLSVGLAVLGASKPLTALNARPQLIGLMMAYLLFNGLVSGVTLGLDRSNITRAIAWLEQHTHPDDLILTFEAGLSLHGGQDLCGRAVPIIRSEFDVPLGQVQGGDGVAKGALIDYLHWDPGQAQSRYISANVLSDMVVSHPASTLYFLYTDHYDFRDRLYLATRGRNRFIRHDLYGLLKDGDVGEEALAGLRGCGLKRLDREKLLRALAASAS